MSTTSADLYDRDLYAWTRQQATALRKLAERWNGPLDLENLAEEIEDVGSDRRDTVVSQIRRLLVHLLKLEHSPSPQPRRQWLVAVNDAHAEAAQRWAEAIGREVVAGFDATYRRVRRQAALELLDHGERPKPPVPCRQASPTRSTSSRTRRRYGCTISSFDT